MPNADPPLLVAAEWLLEFLLPGPQPAGAVFTAAVGEWGLSRRTLQRAKRLLGVASRKHGYQGVWYWIHPDQVWQYDPAPADLRRCLELRRRAHA